MRNVEMVEAEGHLPALVAEAEGGQEVVLMREGTEVARIVPPQPNEIIVTAEQRARALKAVAEIEELSKKFNLGPFNFEEYKAARDEGRR